MTRSKRIQPVVRIAENREQDAARVLGESLKQLEAQEQRLQELTLYRDEYTRRFQNHAGGGMVPARMQDFRAFLVQLNQAIDQQRDVVERVRRESEQCRHQWLDQRTRAKALDKVVERYQREELRDADRREQKLLDEFAGRPRQDRSS